MSKRQACSSLPTLARVICVSPEKRRPPSPPYSAQSLPCVKPGRTSAASSAGAITSNIHLFMMLPVNAGHLMLVSGLARQKVFQSEHAAIGDDPFDLLGVGDVFQRIAFDQDNVRQLARRDHARIQV